jgi:hypothetical protein
MTGVVLMESDMVCFITEFFSGVMNKDKKRVRIAPHP